MDEIKITLCCDFVWEEVMCIEMVLGFVLTMN
jgi:hypothetical protein